MFKKLNIIKNNIANVTNNIANSIKNILQGNNKINNDSLKELEKILLKSDIGYDATTIIIDKIKLKYFDKSCDLLEFKKSIANEIIKIIENNIEELQINDNPNVLVICGINGNGKTTTVAKIANLFLKKGTKTAVVACDTFRAGAQEQLKIWTDQMPNCKFISGQLKSDPASIAFKSMEDESLEMLLIDTAGRLHTEQNLMQELQKITNVIKKHPRYQNHKSIIVIDANVGQNAMNQINIFKEVIDIDGIIITKLDGTSKAGIIVNICKTHKDIKIYFTCHGEKIDDIKPFCPKKYAYNLMDI